VHRRLQWFVMERSTDLGVFINFIVVLGLLDFMAS